MRIVVTADTHLDQAVRWDEQIRLLDWLVGDIAERKPDLICHAGDLFERRPSRGERAMAADWFRRLADISPMLAVNGNHSGPEYLAPLDSRFPREELAELLGWAPSMSSPVAGRFPVTVESEADVHVIAGCAVACLSWPSRAALLAATNMSNGWAQQVGHHDMQNVLRHLGATLESHPGPRILISHATVTGARTQTGFEALGTDFEVSLSDLSLAHADATILGHIHDAELNRWDIDGAPVTYCGSSRHCNWGERGNCYYVVVDIPDDRSGPATVEYVRVPATPLVALEAEWTPAGWDRYSFIPEGTVAGAEVRLRYKVAIEQREVAAKAAAAVAEDLVSRCGAVSVKLEPITKVVTRARAPEVGTSREVPDKLRALWRHQNAIPSPEVEARLVARLEELRAGMDDEYQGKRVGSVIPQSVVLHDVGPYSHVEVDLVSVAGPIVATIGDPGAGKSTLWEHAILGAIDRNTVNSGSLKDRARSRESYIKTTFLVGGKTVVIKQSHDQHTDKGTSEVWVDQKPILSAAGIKEYKAWRQEALPSTAVLKASLFSFQRINQGQKEQGAFLGLTDADRISVILEATGCGYLEEMAKGARDRARAASAALDIATQRLEDEKARGGTVEDAELGVSQALGARDAAQATLDLARVALGAGEEALRAHSAAQDAFLAAVAERGKLEAQILERRVELERIDHTICEASALVDQADEIRDAAARGAKLSSDLTKISETRARVAAELSAAMMALSALEEQSSAAEENGKQWRARLDSAKAQLARKAEVAAAKASLQALEAAVTKAGEDLRDRETVRQLSEDRAREMAKLEAQAKADEGLIGPAQYRMEQAADVLKRRPDVEAAAASLEALQAKVAELDASLEAARAEEAGLRNQHIAGSEERIGGLREGLRSIWRKETDGDTPEGRAADTLANDDQAKRDSTELPKEIEKAGSKIGSLRVQHQTARAKLDQAERLAARANEMSAAAASLASAKTELAGAQARAQAARKRVSDEKAGDKLARARERELAARGALDGAKTRLADARELAALGEAMEAAELELESATEQVEVFRAKWVEIRVLRVNKQAEIDSCTAKLDDLDEQENATELVLCSLSDLIAKVEPLASAEGVIETCRDQRMTVLSAMIRLEGELAATPVPQAPEQPLVDLSALRITVLSAEGSLSELNASLGSAQHALERARASAERVVELAAETERLGTELSDWNRLAKDLGRTGVQALEIDCAGPELTAWANKYLECWGPRFRVSIDTQRAHSSEDRMIEQCAVTVLDSREGTAREGRTFSGGETAILSRAMSLALASMACERAGMENAVLFEDEASGSLSEAYCETYLSMLRKAIQLTRVSKVVTISHQTTIHEGADSRILVRYDESSHESSVQIAA